MGWWSRGNNRDTVLLPHRFYPVTPGQATATPGVRFLLCGSKGPAEVTFRVPPALPFCEHKAPRESAEEACSLLHLAAFT